MNKKKVSDRPEWTMPAWMEKYRDKINNTGGNPIEELMNDSGTTVFNNAPRAIICACVESQVGLLMTLYDKGLIQ